MSDDKFDQLLKWSVVVALSLIITITSVIVCYAITGAVK